MNLNLDELGSAVSYMLTERLAGNLQLNNENSTIGKFISLLKNKSNIQIDLLEFFSFFREVEVVTIDDKNYMFWDEAYFVMINNLIKTSLIFDKRKGYSLYRNFIILLFLERSIAEKSYLTNGIFDEYLKSADTLIFSRVELNEDLEHGLISRIIFNIKLFTYFHELTHLFYNKDDNSYNDSIEYYLNFITLDNDVIKFKSDNEFEKEKYFKISNSFHTNSALKEELISDYEAILTIVQLCKDEDEVWETYLSQLYLFKLMSTFSNINYIIKLSQFADYKSNYNYTEQRVRLDFRCSVFFDTVFKNVFNSNRTDYETSRIKYNYQYKPFIERFEDLRLSVESEIFNSGFYKKIHSNSISKNIKFSDGQILKILGWLE